MDSLFSTHRIPNSLITDSLTRQDASKFAVDRSSNTMYYFKRKGDVYQLKQEPANFDKQRSGLGTLRYFVLRKFNTFAE